MMHMCCFCREHEKPSDAAVITSRDSRHSIILRSTDTSSAATQTLRQLVALVQGSIAAPAGHASQGGETVGLAADEALARRLQVRMPTTSDVTCTRYPVPDAQGVGMHGRSHIDLLHLVFDRRRSGSELQMRLRHRRPSRLWSLPRLVGLAGRAKQGRAWSRQQTRLMAACHTRLSAMYGRVLRLQQLPGYHHAALPQVTAATECW